jgi:alpha-glucosidase
MYQLESWSDGVNADRNGQDFRYRTQQVSSTDKLPIKLAPGGGWAGRIKAASAASKVSLSAP